METGEVEIIEFIRPTESEKNLYITNIPAGITEEELSESLYTIFSKYGLLFEVQVIPVVHLKPAGDLSPMGDTAEKKDKEDMERQFYAFVKYFSAADAYKAKTELSGRLLLKGRLTRIRFAFRNKSVSAEKCPLYISKCFELANYLLGFSGWKVKIVDMQNESNLLPEPGDLHFVCVVRLDITNHSIHSYGYAASQQKWDTKDPSAKGVGICKARKEAYRFAVQDAFSKVLVVKLPNGKLLAEVNTTVEEQIHYDQDLNLETLVQVNNLAEPPSLSESEDEIDIDILNKQMLEDLDEQNC